MIVALPGLFSYLFYLSLRVKGYSVSSFFRSFLIGSVTDLQGMRTGTRTWTSSKFSQIRFSMQGLVALEHSYGFCMGKIVSPYFLVIFHRIFFIFAGNNDR